MIKIRPSQSYPNTSPAQVPSTTPAQQPVWEGLRSRLLRPRWCKIWGDLQTNKLRSVLVVLSVAIGVFAIGAIMESRELLLRGLAEGYVQARPFSAALTVTTRSAFDDELVEAVKHIPGVAEAVGRTTANVRLNIGTNRWADLRLFPIPDWDDLPIGRMRLEYGKWPPDDKELLIERSALSDLLDYKIHVGDNLAIETLDQKRRTLRVVGIVHDLTVHPSFMSGDFNGYITEDTLKWLGESPSYTQLQFTVEPGIYYDKAAITQVAYRVRDKVEKSDREIATMFVPPQPGKSPIATFILDPVIYILSALGVMAVFLGTFLVTNTISALLTQQMRQIGILKAIGASTSQIAWLYLILVLIFGLFALVIAVPCSHLAAVKFSLFFAHFLNFDVQDHGILPDVLFVQGLVSLVVPVLASIYPTLRGTRITVHTALSNDSLRITTVKGKKPKIAPFRSLLPAWSVWLLSLPGRPLLLSLRNTFRRKGRLVLTLATLTLGGAIFIGVMSVQASLNHSLELLLATLVRFDIQVSFDIPYHISRVEHEALQVSGVAYVESSGFVRVRRLRPDGTESNLLMFQSLPINSTLLQPVIVEGRWLLPADESAIVVSTSFMSEESDLRLGDTIVVSVNGRETTWRVVGVFQGLGRDLLAYTNYPYFAREMHEAGQTRRMQIITTRHDDRFRDQIAQRLEEHFRGMDVRVSDTLTATRERTTNERQFNLLITLLVFMAALIAIVGGLGLMGTMSINVLERTREIGIMRAIGASDGAVLRIIITEGILIGIMSWVFSTLLGIPLSQFLCYHIGKLFTGAPLVYTFPIAGVLMWLVAVVILAAVASFLPAWNASRLTVRDVLSFEG